MGVCITLCRCRRLRPSPTSLAPLLLEAGKFALSPISQPFEHDSHLSQFGLKFGPSLVRSAAIQFHIDLALDGRCLIGGVL